MKILIVDNNIHIKTYPQGHLIRLCCGWKHQLSIRVKNPTDLTDNDYDVDRVILSGSTAYVRQNLTWMQKERHFIDGWMKNHTPILGICFGSQLLAQHIFGNQAVEALPYPINGTIACHQVGTCTLFKHLPSEFNVMSTHYEGFIVPQQYCIAQTTEWPFYGFQYPHNIFAIQFHPELSGPIGKLLVSLQRLMYDRHIYQDFSLQTHTSTGKQIIHNFLQCDTI